MEALAVHLMVDLHDCPYEILNDVEKLRRSLQEASRIAKTTVLGEAFHRFQPQGVSGVLLVSESHLSVHTWPERNYAAVDIFTCGDRRAARRAIDFIVRALQATSYTIGRTERGIEHGVERTLPSMSPLDLESRANLAATR